MAEKLRYAKDEKCCKCGEPAVCFWPIVDPDIQEHPYCRKCVDDAKMRVMLEINKKEEWEDQRHARRADEDAERIKNET